METRLESAYPRFFTAVIKNGGAAANVVPEYASLSIYYRAPTIPELEELGKRVEDCARAGALLSNTEVKLSTPNPKYLPLRTNATLADHYRRHCEPEGLCERGRFEFVLI